MSFLFVLACLSPLPVEVLVDDDLDGYFADEDCDDGDPSVFPSAEEICDGLDNDCDGDIDEDGLTRFYPDADNDGYGEAGSVGEEDCGIEPNRATNDEDCDDTDSLVNPLADEVCDGVDNNCDGTIDEPEAIDALDWFPDEDADGYGDPLEGQRTCDPEPDWVQDDQDCDDLNPEVNPSADEVCNGLDDDCEGGVDLDAIDALSWYADTDSDSFGDPAELLLSCTQPSAYVADDTDCDDTTGSTYPGAEESVADGVDSDCDGQELCYADKDSDSWGDEEVASSDLSCSAENLANQDGDCDDGDAFTFPGSSPNDSSTSCMTDADEDDYGDASPSSGVTVGTDCDDTDAAVNTAATEITGDNVDQDCDGGEICYVDSDGDGQGSTSTVVSTDSDCRDSGESRNTKDCDDGDASVYLGATETVGDEVDSDCDGGELCYTDSDSDGYGSTVTLSSTDADCSDSGESTNDEDCDDAEALANPGETEICDDGIDNDCSGEFEDCGPYGSFDVDGGDVLLEGSYNYDKVGTRLASGDFDNDGQDDLWVGAQGFDNSTSYTYRNLDRGAAMLHLGPITADADPYTGADAVYSSSTSYSYLGQDIAVADMNGDGKDDLIMSALDGPNSSLDSYDGATYIWLGPITSSASSIDNGSSADWFAYGGNNDRLGWDLGVGDLNGDGQDDLVTGNPWDNEGGYDYGTAFVFYGPLSSYSSSGDSYDYKLSGDSSYDYGGSDVFLADLDGDGIDDLIVGAVGEASYDGAIYVLTGPVSSDASLSASSYVLTGSGTELIGTEFAAGDFDGDGNIDLAAGATYYGSNDRGQTYIFDGPITGGTVASQSSTQIEGSTSYSYSGATLASGCDVDGDGLDDLLVGAPTNGSGGSAYLFLGGFASGSLALGTDENANFDGDGDDEAGTSLLCGHDLNGDGIDDIAVGSPYDGSDEGEVGIFFGGGE